MRTTVLIADDNAFVRAALYEFFTRRPRSKWAIILPDTRPRLSVALQRGKDEDNPAMAKLSLK